MDGQAIHVLFDTGATHSFVVPAIAERMSAHKTPEKSTLRVHTPGGQVLESRGVLPKVPVMVEGVEMPVSLIVIPMQGYEVILGMDWLSQHRATLDYRRGRIHFDRSQGEVTYQGVRQVKGLSVISAMRAERMLLKGCDAYLATISVVEVGQKVQLQDIPVVREFEDVFQELQGLPSARGELFEIELEPKTAPIAKAPYRMAPTEMAELTK